MRRHFRLPMAVIAGALLGLIALLATLQYRWLGQISGAERDRMKATLNTRATAFAQDVDRELTRAYLLFQLEPVPPDRSSASSVAARADRWQATARFPRMIKDVYLVDAEAGAEASPLQRYNPATRFIEPAAWPAALADVKAAVQHAAAPVPAPPPPSGNQAFVLRAPVPAMWSSIPAIVIPAPMLMVNHIAASAGAHAGSMRMSSGFRYTVLVLDADYLRDEMLPALARQHFQDTGDGFDYQLAVVATAAPNAPLYHSVSSFTPAVDANVDAKVDLFQVRVKDFEPLVAEVNRFATFTAISRGSEGQRTKAIVRQGITAPRADVAITSAPLSIVVQNRIQNGASDAAQQRIGAMLSGAATAFGGRPAATGQWRLLVKHPSGSLERAVNAARRRNLLISSSILGILGISVGFLVLSTRRAHDLARQQLEFVATVSHELRTPLAVIRSAADNLADGVVDDAARIRQYGELVRREGLRLTDLVEQILEFAGLQSGANTVTAKPVLIGPLLRDVAAAAEATALPGLHIDLIIAEGLPAVAGDEASLRRLFQNLVGNALKYGAEARWVGIRASVAGSSVDVSVSDHGIGIAAADQARIFDPFYRAPDVVAAQIQGAGLGLSLVKRIVDAHAGRIVVSSTPGQGSTFTVTLPVLQGDSAERTDSVGDAAPQPL